jgi:hypothetical protein
MAKIEKPNKKGIPPSVTETTVGTKGIPPSIASQSHNLTKPDSSKNVLINFSATPEFRKELKIYAAELGLTVTQLIMEAIDNHKKTNSI